MVPHLLDVEQIERSPPGAAGTQPTEGSRMRLIDYDERGLTERDLVDPQECGALRNRPSATWVNVDGLEDRARIEQLGQAMGLHPLTVEAILYTAQRPKVEEYGDYLYLVAKMLDIDRAQGRVRVDQLSLILGERFLVSVQEQPGDPFDPVRNRIRAGAGRIRKSGTDYLPYALLDLTVDRYFEVIDCIGERIDMYRDLLAGVQEMYLARVSNRIGTVMKILAVVSSVFLPLNSITGASA